jgi:molecular chaperone DnaK
MTIYGIDLGTTNSLIGTVDGIIGEMLPSIASFETKEAGEKYREDYSAIRSFKVNMSLGEEGKESVVASGLVLKALVGQAKEKGHDVKEVVISVPAYFSDNQRQATIRSATTIGLDVKALINEPTAAAMKYSQSKKSLNLVYDLGGGTFDVSVIDSRFGNFDVQATDGLTIGGDNFDRALMKNVLKSANFRMHKMSPTDMIHLKSLCEGAKIFLQKKKADTDIDLREFSHATTEEVYTLTTATYKEIMRIVFGPTIEKTKQVVAEAIEFGESYKLLMVGGSTRDPYLQEWVADVIGKQPEELTYDPDMIVAEGACLYAHLIETGEAEVMVSDVTKALGIGMRDGTVHILIQKNSKLPISSSKMMTNYSDSDGLELELYQGDSILAKHNEFIGRMLYPFGETKGANASNVKVTIEVNSDGIITLRAKELLKPEKVIKIDRSDV